MEQLNNSSNNNIESSIIFKNQQGKKPTNRKTLNSEYVLNDFFQTNDINNFHPIQNVQNEESKNKGIRTMAKNVLIAYYDDGTPIHGAGPPMPTVRHSKYRNWLSNNNEFHKLNE